jgi:hypothetical protein
MKFLIIFFAYLLLFTLGSIAIISILIYTISGGRISVVLSVIIGIVLFIILVPIINAIFRIKKKINERVVSGRYNNRKTIILEESELIKKFETDEIEADKQLKGKVIVLTGRIHDKSAFISISPLDEKLVADVCLIDFGDHANDKICITCYFNTMVTDDLNDNEIITVAGKYRKYRENTNLEEIDIILGDCKIIGDEKIGPGRID